MRLQRDTNFDVGDRGWFVSGGEIYEGKVIKISLEVGNITAQPNASEVYYYMLFDNCAVIPVLESFVFKTREMCEEWKKIWDEIRKESLANNGNENETDGQEGNG